MKRFELKFDKFHWLNILYITGPIGRNWSGVGVI